MSVVRKFMRRRARGGFSLIEVLVAVLIAVTVVLSLATGTLAVMKANRLSQKYSNATALAQDQMARLREQAKVGPAIAAGTRAASGFDLAWTPVAVPTGASGVLKAVELTVSWTDFRTHTLTFWSIFDD